MSTQTETHAFQAEVSEVLSLVVHSLYSNREIFLRELISNASDALDKLRFEALTAPELMGAEESLGIVLDADPEARTLTIADNGIGMTREELVQNLGTIASSGTRRFLDALKEGGAENAPDLIGQFGVGFYSAFMVASEVRVTTCRAGESSGSVWVSGGEGSYSLEEADGLGRGTIVTLSLREGDEFDAFLQEFTLREVVRKYSDFVEYPIQMQIERTKPKLDDEGKPIEGETETNQVTDTLNSMKPLWAKPKEEITDEEHEEFYKHLSRDWNAPFDTIHFRAEGTLEYTALLYLPAQQPFDLFDPAARASKVSLYVRRILIMRDCEDLLPGWLRFVRGVVESNDLPLNVSREVLQDDPRVRQIQKRLVRKVLDSLKESLADDRERYEEFWRNFGVCLKEGIYYGDDVEQRVSGVSLFGSSHGEGLTTLAEYVERMGDDQDAIYALTGTSRKVLECSPHLEALASQGVEVLFLTDPVDEWMLQRLTEWDGKPIRQADKGEGLAEGDEAKAAREEKQKEFEGLLGAMQAALADDIQEVRFSARLKNSAAVLVGEENALSPQLERMLRRSGQDVPKQKRILELNPGHALVTGLEKLHAVDAQSPRVAEIAELLYGQALIAEGMALEDPGRFTKLLTELMTSSVKG
ncbi:MAG: molecular chaperone HtpG [Planctomycetota bacterium]|nr:molecular chaperone HtpG [Planctomycetota bacterium]